MLFTDTHHLIKRKSKIAITKIISMERLNKEWSFVQKEDTENPE